MDDYHVNCAPMVPQYLVPDLERLALERLKARAVKLREPHQVLDIIEAIRDETRADGPLHIAKHIEEQHRSLLLKYGPYRDMVAKDDKMIWDHLDAFNFTDDVANIGLVKCHNCGRVRLGKPTRVPDTVRCNKRYWADCDFTEPISCWVSKREAKSFNPE